MSEDFLMLLDEFEKEKGISRNVLIEALETALVSAYKKNYGARHNVRVEINRLNGGMNVYIQKTVVAEVEDPLTQISLAEAKAINPIYEEEDIVEEETVPQTFGRIAAQTARQVVTQRIREAERGIIYNEFISKENDIITGIVQRVEKRNVMVDIGKTEAILTPQEQAPTEMYKNGQRVKVYVVEVQNTTKGPQITISRTHPGLVRRLFELEVPEIQNGTVEIKSIAREAGSRTKIAVLSSDPNVDPIGACVGPKGARVQKIVDELKGEKIDIIKYSENVPEYVSAALAPAKALSARADEESKICSVTVAGHQLSLAIGKEGQNARLAAKLTGWKIDIIKSEGDEAEKDEA
ncbi:MAG: transcription termination factor NusA [Clostridiales bacterium]|jgi:N utilization substance protein A|nr:transcription termination factor NusA [Clostridiales bacterium]